MSNKPTIRITLDGREMHVPAQSNIINVAKESGVEIPHYCYHPALPVAGNCRMCFVEIEGLPQPQIACNTPLKDGMVIKTSSPMATEARKWTLEFLLANHPLDCPVCDKAGECELQNYTYKYGKVHTDFVETKRTPATVPLSDKLFIEKDRCILCLRCVNFLKDIGGKEELYVEHRGNHSEIAIAPGKPVESNYQLNTADICPVGALSPTNFRFAERVWNLTRQESICPLCPRGCNTHVDVKELDGELKAQRVVPRLNKEVNSYWMCDEGRYYFRDYHERRQRLNQFQKDGQPIQTTEFFGNLAAILKNGDSAQVLVLVSNWLCNEDIRQIDSFVKRHLPKATLSGPAITEGGDHLLKRNDFGPNALGLRDLLRGQFSEPSEVRGKFRCTLSFGVNPQSFADPGETVFIGPYQEHFLNAVKMSAPGLAHGEIDGSYTNFNSVQQSFTTLLRAPAFAYSIEDFLTNLQEKLQ